MEIGMPHVGVHQQHVAHPELSQADRAVRRDRGLAVLLLERGHQHGLGRAIRRGVYHARPQIAERLRENRAGRLVSHQCEGPVGAGAPSPAPRGRPSRWAGSARARRHQPEGGDAQEGLDLPGIPDARVQVLEEEREGHAADQAHQAPDQQVEPRARVRSASAESRRGPPPRCSRSGATRTPASPSGGWTARCRGPGSCPLPAGGGCTAPSGRRASAPAPAARQRASGPRSPSEARPGTPRAPPRRTAGSRRGSAAAPPGCSRPAAASADTRA